VEALAPENLFREYILHTFGSDLGDPAEDDRIHERFTTLDDPGPRLKQALTGTALGVDGFQEALRLLSDVEGAATAAVSPSRAPDPGSNATTTRLKRNTPTGVLRLASVTVEGFGPFGQPATTYPLDRRGLVLIRGLHEDVDGAGGDAAGKSNGAGKTALAMAALWGLTGRTDSRPAGGLDASVGDVVHTASQPTPPKTAPWARVTVRGWGADGSAFEITRQRSGGNGGSPKLSVVVDGVDLATQAVRDTQAALEERLGFTTNLLSRLHPPLRTIFVLKLMYHLSFSILSPVVIHVFSNQCSSPQVRILWTASSGRSPGVT
jgi:hypothetical protein